MLDRKQNRRPVRYRIRKKVSGDSERLRLAVFRSNKHFYLQAIDDAKGETVAQVSTRGAENKGKGSNVKAATAVGEKMATLLKEKGIKEIVFDRGGFIYHGRVKAAADAVRKAGFKF